MTPARRLAPPPRLLAIILLAVAGGLVVLALVSTQRESQQPPCLAEAEGSHLVQVIAARPADRPEEQERGSVVARISDAVRQADDYLAASGPGHRIRWACEGRTLAIADVTAPPIGEDGVMTFAEVVTAAVEAGHQREDRLYAIFYPAGAGYEEVGEATGPGDASQGPQFAMMTEWTGFWTLHEVGHTLGAVPGSAPHQFAQGHCNQLNDVMCRRLQDLDDPDYAAVVQLDCPEAPEWLFDCNHDDYYLHDGDWWDVADSPYLYRAPVQHRPPPVPRK